MGGKYSVWTNVNLGSYFSINYILRVPPDKNTWLTLHTKIGKALVIPELTRC